MIVGNTLPNRGESREGFHITLHKDRVVHYRTSKPKIHSEDIHIEEFLSSVLKMAKETTNEVLRPPPPNYMYILSSFTEKVADIETNAYNAGLPAEINTRVNPDSFSSLVTFRMVNSGNIVSDIKRLVKKDGKASVIGVSSYVPPISMVTNVFPLYTDSAYDLFERIDPDYEYCQWADAGWLPVSVRMDREGIKDFYDRVEIEKYIGPLYSFLQDLDGYDIFSEIEKQFNSLF